MNESPHDSILRVAELVALMVQQSAAVDAAELALRAAKDAYTRTEQEDLPELMREFGLTELRLEDGTRVDVREDVQAAITEERRASAHAWLREHGFGGLIKTAVTVSFGRNEEDQARVLAQRLAEEKYATDCAESVNPQTLRAFVRERLEAGDKIPFDLFGVRPFNRARIEAPKKPRAKKAAAS